MSLNCESRSPGSEFGGWGDLTRDLPKSGKKLSSGCHALGEREHDLKNKFANDENSEDVRVKKPCLRNNTRIKEMVPIKDRSKRFLKKSTFKKGNFFSLLVLNFQSR